MKAYITGATGCVGRNLVDKLVKQNCEVIVLHRTSSNLKKLEGCNVKLKEVSMENYDSLKKTLTEKADVIFHIAANVSHDPEDLKQQEIDNVVVTENLVRLCLEEKIVDKFIFCSTGAAALCDNMSMGQIEDVSSGYVKTKKKAELIVQAALKDKDFDAVILRPIIVVGKYDYSNYSKIFKLINEGKMPFSIPGKLSFCHAEDVADAHMSAILNGKRGYTYYVTGEYTSWHDFYCRVADKLGRPHPKKPPHILVYYIIAYISVIIQKLTGKKALVTPELIDLISKETYDINEVEKFISKKHLKIKTKSLDKAIDDCYNWMKDTGML